MEFSKNGTYKGKKFMSSDELEEILVERRDVYIRSKRSYELEAMNVKVRDLKHMYKEDVDELRRIHKDNFWYKLYFSGVMDHVSKVLVLAGALAIFARFYGIASLIAFLPLVLVSIMLLFFIRLTRGY